MRLSPSCLQCFHNIQLNSTSHVFGWNWSLGGKTCAQRHAQRVSVHAHLRLSHGAQADRYQSTSRGARGGVERVRFRTVRALCLLPRTLGEGVFVRSRTAKDI